MRPPVSSFALLGFCVSLALAGCSSEGGGGDTGGGGGDGGTGSGADGSGRADGATGPFADATTSPSWTRLEIRPPSATVTSVNGAPATVAFEAFAIDARGSEEEVTARAVWRSREDRLGSVGASTGRYTALGTRAGTDTLRATLTGLEATAEVRVELSISRTEGGAPGSAESMFGGPASGNAARRPSIVYPETRTIIPKNLVPMSIQWDAPAELDLFRLTLAGPRFRGTIYTTQREAKLTKMEWIRLLESTAPGAIRVEVAGVVSSDPAEIHVSAPVEIQVADGLMRGTIYYWALNIGRILAIRPGAESYEDFFTPPPDQGTSNRCVGCHTLSRDGTRMAFEYWGGWRTSGVIDVVNPDPPVIGPSVFAANFMAFDPTGTKLLGVLSGALSVYDARTGASLESVLPNGSATMPIWSPDGNTIAYSSAIAGQPFGDVDFFQADLSVIRDFNGMRSAPTILVPSGGMANSYPSFSPDSRVIAYGRGPYSRSHREFDPANRSGLSPGDLYVVPADGSAAPVLLASASRNGQAFLPAFSPFASGGYLWLAFFSRRDYGNVTEGTRRRQIWVTALEQSAPAGRDSSAPAFWLPAQEPATENMSAYWAPDPCHPSGDTCDFDEDCCAGPDPTGPGALLCRPDAQGTRRCIPRASACRLMGEACASNSECCTSEGLTCEQSPAGSTCVRPDL